MKRLLVIVGFIAASVFRVNVMAEPLDSLESISALEWENRVLLISSDSKLKDQYLDALSDYEEQVFDRDLIWFYLVNDELETNYPHSLDKNFINNTFVNNRGQWVFQEDDRVVLIGKDGGVKLRQNVLDLKQVFALIDTMPMRLDEMKSRR